MINRERGPRREGNSRSDLGGGVVMQVKGLSWLGLRTPQFDEMVKFFRDVMGMKPIRDEPGVAGFQMIDGTNLELYAFDEEFHAFFTTGSGCRLSGRRRRRIQSYNGSGRCPVHWSNPTHGQIELESLPRSGRHR